MSSEPSTHADAPDQPQVRAALQLLSTRLTLIHRALIGEATTTWALSTGAPPPGPLELFRLLREDAAFAWLQPITRLIIETDALASEFDSARTLAATREISSLLDAGDTELAVSYRRLLQSDVEFAGAHAELRGALKQIRSMLVA